MRYQEYLNKAMTSTDIEELDHLLADCGLWQREMIDDCERHGDPLWTVEDSFHAIDKLMFFIEHKICLLVEMGEGQPAEVPTPEDYIEVDELPF